MPAYELVLNSWNNALPTTKNKKSPRIIGDTGILSSFAYLYKLVGTSLPDCLAPKFFSNSFDLNFILLSVPYCF